MDSNSRCLHTTKPKNARTWSKISKNRFAHNLFLCRDKYHCKKQQEKLKFRTKAPKFCAIVSVKFPFFYTGKNSAQILWKRKKFTQIVLRKKNWYLLPVLSLLRIHESQPSVCKILLLDFPPLVYKGPNLMHCIEFAPVFDKFAKGQSQVKWERFRAKLHVHITVCKPLFLPICSHISPRLIMIAVLRPSRSKRSKDCT